ncbi:MAG TPA: cell division protein FtsA [Candidatus Paceibacterota bacterium]|nr:cell division protein FtsA [Candidatus Paceibacterota bacterium]
MKRYYTGIDIGTYHVKVVIAEAAQGGGLRIAGSGSAVSKGMRHGYIINTKDATRSIAEAVRTAEQAAGTKVKSAAIAIGGVGLDELRSTGEVSLTTSGGVVTPRDLERVVEDSEKRISAQLTNRRVIHALPTSYQLDGTKVPGRPVGMRGSKLTVDTLLVTTLEQHYNDLIEAVEGAGIEVEGEMASPLAASLVSLTKEQKMKGVVLANIGAETVSIAVFEDDLPISVKVFPTGSSDITNDLALSLQLPLSEAEQVKRGAVMQSDVPRKKIDDIVGSRLKDIFSIIDAHLKAISRHRILPGGIVITGGGSSIVGAKDIAKATLKLPSQLGSAAAARAISADATWAVAYGLTRWGYSTDAHYTQAGWSDGAKDIMQGVLRGLRSLLP